MHPTYRYKLKPTAVQRERLFAILREDRELYNAALEERIDCCGKTGRTLTAFDRMKSLTIVRRDDPERASGHAVRQRGPLFRLDRAYGAFFRRARKGGRPGFPRFRGAKFWKTIEIPEGYRVGDGRFRSRDFAHGIRLDMSRPIPDGARHCGATITLTAKGWHLCLKPEVPTPEPKPVESISDPIGIDMGLKALVAKSDGTLIPPPMFERGERRRIRRLQRLVARSKRGSRSSGRKKAALARAHLKVANRRRDFLHKLSTEMCRQHDLVAHEDLKIRNMTRNRHLARSIHDASRAMFPGMIGYKAARGGTHAVAVDPRGTSLECSGCGAAVEKHLGIRTHRCDRCGLVPDRDVNAAINVLGRAGTALSPATHGPCGTGSERIPARETRVGANVRMAVKSSV